MSNAQNKKRQSRTLASGATVGLDKKNCHKQIVFLISNYNTLEEKIMSETTKKYAVRVAGIVNASFENEPELHNQQILSLEKMNGRPIESGEFYLISYRDKQVIRKIFVTEQGFALVCVNPEYPSAFYSWAESKIKPLRVQGKINKKFPNPESESVGK
jgi:hypothetical protein